MQDNNESKYPSSVAIGRGDACKPISLPELPSILTLYHPQHFTYPTHIWYSHRPYHVYQTIAYRRDMLTFALPVAGGMWSKYCCYTKQGGIITNLALRNFGGRVIDMSEYPQYGYMEHGLKYIAFCVEKHIAHRAVCYSFRKGRPPCWDPAIAPHTKQWVNFMATISMPTISVNNWITLFNSCYQQTPTFIQPWNLFNGFHSNKTRQWPVISANRLTPTREINTLIAIHFCSSTLGLRSHYHVDQNTVFKLWVTSGCSFVIV